MILVRSDANMNAAEIVGLRKYAGGFAEARWREAEITPEEIVNTFQVEFPPPVAAYHAANRQRLEAVPVFIEYIEAAAEANDVDREADFRAADWLMMLLAEWRETRAYRPMARLLACNYEFLDALLADGLTEDIHKCMAGVFDGDLEVLFELIRNEKANEYVRGGMLNALIIIGLRNPDHLGIIQGFLKEFAAAHFAEAPDYVWSVWAECVGFLGFAELKVLVRHMFAANKITPEYMNFEHFEADLKKGLDPDARDSLIHDYYYSIWDDTLGTIEFWIDREKKKSSAPKSRSHTQPGGNSIKIGRNEPCPCGSGLKYKKCCLGEK